MASCKSVASFCSGETEVNHEDRESEQAHLITVGGGGRIRCDDGDNTNANVINNNNNNNISHFNMSDPPHQPPSVCWELCSASARLLCQAAAYCRISRRCGEICCLRRVTEVVSGGCFSTHNLRFYPTSRSKKNF